MDKSEILIIEDEPQSGKLLRIGLSNFRYEVIVVTNKDEALKSLASRRSDIILIDINQDPHSGISDMCREFSELSSTPIIALVVKNDRKTKLSVLNAGADDCITKPFDMEELEARIRAVLRRAVVGAASPWGSEVHIHDLVIDLLRRRITLKGDEIHLTPTEYKLLSTLATHPGEVLTYSTLIEAVRGKFDPCDPEHHVRVYINTLRKKLQDDSTSRTQPRFIINESGVGYRFADYEPDRTQTREPIPAPLT